MTIKPGSILRMKINGETVFVLGEANTIGSLTVRRGRVTRDGVEYVSENFRKDELEPVEENITREFKEGLFRQKLMNDYIASQETLATDRTPEIIQ